MTGRVRGVNRRWRRVQAGFSAITAPAMTAAMRRANQKALMRLKGPLEHTGRGSR